MITVPLSMALPGAVTTRAPTSACTRGDASRRPSSGEVETGWAARTASQAAPTPSTAQPNQMRKGVFMGKGGRYRLEGTARGRRARNSDGEPSTHNAELIGAVGPPLVGAPSRDAPDNRDGAPT